MNGLPYYKAYPRDFLDGTVGMRFEMKGAYRLVLDLIYMHGGELPDDPQYIAGQLGMSVRKWNSLRRELLALGKISADLEIISNFRADKELITLRSYQEKQAENRRGARKNKGLQKPPSQPKQNHTESEPEYGGGSAREATIDRVVNAANADVRKSGWYDFNVSAAIQRWAALGLTEEEIVGIVASATASKRDGPANSPNYFDRIMERCAGEKQRAPLSASAPQQRRPSHGQERFDRLMRMAARRDGRAAPDSGLADGEGDDPPGSLLPARLVAGGGGNAG